MVAVVVPSPAISPVFGHGGAAELFVDHHIASLGAEGGFHRAAEFLHSAQEGLARRFVKDQLFCCHVSCVFYRKWRSFDDRQDVGGKRILYSFLHPV
jgi:hypothetical protein